jgi:hypothetical protein
VSTDVQQQRPRTVGRRCTVCALPPDARLSVETALAQGEAYRVISRASGGRVEPDALRRHVVAGHLPPQLQDAAEATHGLDSTTLAYRIHEIAQRARETALEAQRTGHHSAVIRAGDAEARALGILVGLGVRHEGEVQDADAFKQTARAVVRAARHNRTVAEVVAAELDALDRPAIADDIRAQFPTHPKEIHE